MRHIFILNPSAGRKDRTAMLKGEILSAAERCNIKPEIVVTKYKGYATKYTKELISSTDEVCRFYACGGDGTINEVVNGVAGYANAQIACYPCGTGNDFVKIFDNRDAFLNFDNLIKGDTTPVDVINAGGYRSINIFSTGIDARVAHWVCKNKRKVPVGGKVPYDVALLVTFLRKLDRYYEIEIDGKRYDDDYYIIVAASGRYYGGGYYVMPEAEPGDGLLDILLVKNIGRSEIIKKIGYFQNGQHEKLGDAAIYLRGKHMKLRSPDPEPLNTDGEINLGVECEIRILTQQLDVVVPEGASMIHSEKAKELART